MLLPVIQTEDRDLSLLQTKWKAILDPMLTKVASLVTAIVTPSGAVLQFTGTSLPSGFLWCDGQAYSAQKYPSLAKQMWNSAQGNWAFGGTGSYPTGTFFVPDMRGAFSRGADNMGTSVGAAGVDPDASTRTAAKTGGNAGNKVGSFQGHAFQTHNHGVNDPGHSHTTNYNAFSIFGSGSNGFGAGAFPAPSGILIGTQPTGITIQSQTASGAKAQATANETRPVNLAFNYIIKT